MTRFVCSRTVIDLGKNVPAEKVVQTVLEKDIQLVGLSALMTTTVANMEDTIKLLREKLGAVGKTCKIMVGGSRPHGGLRKPDWSRLLRQGCYGECWDC